MPRARTIQLVVGGLVAAVVLGALLDATLTLGYVEALAWPAVGLVLVLVLGDDIAALIRGRVVSKVKTPLGELEFAPQPDSVQDDPGDEILSAEYPELVEEYEEALGEALATQDELRQQLAIRNAELDFLRLLASVFDAQLGLLRELDAAPDGLVPDAVQSILRRELEARGTTLLTSTPEWMQFLLGNELTVISAEGNYVITRRGSAFVRYVEQVYHAPKVF